MHTYLLKRSIRKTLALEVTPSLEIVVRAPLRLSQRDIDAFVTRQHGWIDRHLELQRQRALAGPPPEPSPEETDALRRLARDYLPGRVAHFAQMMGLYPSGMKITSARKRFGSCSAKNVLCFSCYLMGYPKEAIDLVVVHELAHIIHKHHGPAFYACIASVLPDHRQRLAMLKVGWSKELPK